MSVPLAVFGDAELVGAAVLSVVAPVVTRTPSDLTPPLIQVQRVGGEDDGVTDRAQLAVTCFGGTRDEAWAMAEQVRQAVLDAAHAEFIYTRSGVQVAALIDTTGTVTPASLIPDQNTAISAVSAVYALGLRRPRII